MEKTKVIRRRRNSEMEAGYTIEQSISNEAKLSKLLMKEKLKSRSERVSGDFEFSQHWKWPNASIHFPDEPWMRTVDKYFPLASGGPLLVDEPETAQDIRKCEIKRPILESLGHRYLVLKPGMTEADDFMELEACGLRAQKQSQI